MSDILITGGAGFLGKNLCSVLSKNNNHIISYDIKDPSSINNTYNKNCVYIQGDLLDKKKLQKVVIEHDINGIIHAGWAWNSNHLSRISVNVNSYLNLAKLAIDYSMKRFVFISSAAIYGNISKDILEGTPFVCNNIKRLYPTEKMMLTTLTMNLALKYPNMFTCLIPGGPIYGPGMRGGYENEWPLYKLIKACSQKKSINWPKGGDQSAEYIHIDDVTRGIRLAYFASTLSHGLYHISYGRKWTTFDIVNAIHSFLPDADLKVGHGLAPQGKAPDDHHRGPLLYERAYDEFNYRPHIDLKDGLKSVYKWLVKNQ